MSHFSIDSPLFNMHFFEDAHPNPDNFYMHAHDRYELFCFMKGSAVFWAEGTPYPLSPGDVMLFNISEAHRISIDPSRPYERMSIHFLPRIFPDSGMVGQLLLPFTSRTLGSRNLLRPEDFKDDYWRMCLRNLLRPSRQRELQVLSNLPPLLNEIRIAFENRSKTDREENTALPAQIVSFVNQNLTEELSPDEIARTFYISKSHLYDLFREATGSSVWEYITIKRLLYARQLLQTGVTPSKAAAQCGFRDYTTFFRAYRKRFGSSPRQDRTLVPTDRDNSLPGK